MRPQSSLWIKIRHASGRWYADALSESLSGKGFSYWVSDENAEFNPDAFSVYPYADMRPVPAPPISPPPYPVDWKEKRIQILVTMARLVTAYSTEISSLCGMRKASVIEELKALEQEGYVKHISPENNGYPFWKITRKGTITAFRFWLVPKGMQFPKRIERSKPLRKHETGGTSLHNRTKRLWAEWIYNSPFKQDVQIFSCWTEVVLPIRSTCDGLCWGTFREQETLFWLESLSSSSLEKMRDTIKRKFRGAIQYSNYFKIPIIFALLGPNWSIRGLNSLFDDIPSSVAVILASWSKFGYLPTPRFGDVVFLLPNRK